MSYNIWNAVAYEITNILIDMNVRIEQNPFVKSIRTYCFYDWVEWKTDRTLQKVDKQINDIQLQAKSEDNIKYVKPIIIEHPSDGSNAQDLLGGTLEIKAPWYDNSKQN
jgi:hypothetical protein